MQLAVDLLVVLRALVDRAPQTLPEREVAMVARLEVQWGREGGAVGQGGREVQWGTCSAFSTARALILSVDE